MGQIKVKINLDIATMQTPEQIIKDKSASWRGTIIHDIAVLERYMDVFLANYFCDNEDKKTEFIDLVLGNNRLSLDSKRKLIDTIFLKSDKEIKKKIKAYSEAMNLAMMERNVFAHNAVDFSQEALSNCHTKIGFFKFGVKSRTDWYDAERMNKIQESVRLCIKFFEIATGNI